MSTKHLDFNFEVKKTKSGGVTIEGFANAATVDRMKEKIHPEGWDLTNYKKNPIVLFDHGHDPTFGFMPIGKAVAVEARPEGLYTKIQLSDSKNEKISAVRDLVEEGILRTFSVGFDPKQSEKAADNPNVTIITKAELIETSIVPIPMNQDSTFSMLRKRKAFWKTPLARKWYDTFCDRVEMIKKGKYASAAINQRFLDLVETGEIRNEDGAVQFIALEAGVTIPEIKAVITGRRKEPLTPSMVKAFASVLKVSADLLSMLDKGDATLLEKVLSREEINDSQGGDAVSKKKTMPKDEGKQDGQAAAPAEGAKPDKQQAVEQKPEDKKPEQKAPEGEKLGMIYAIEVPKSVGSMDAAAKMVSDAGYIADSPTETESAYVFAQAPIDSVDTSAGMKMDVGNGVMACVAPKKSMEGKAAHCQDEGKKAEDPAAAEGEQQAPAGGEGEGKDEFPKDALDAAVTAFEAEMSATQEGLPGNPPSWVSDEALWEKAKRASEAALGEVNYAFVSWWYLNNGGTKKSGEAQTQQKAVGTTDDNPYFKLAEQTNLLLASAVNELKVMSEKLNGLADLTLAQVQHEADDTPDSMSEGKDGDLAKSLDLFRTYERKLQSKLKRLNV